MATKKQRKRELKERRHEYETVWVDSEGNELEEPPDEAPAPSRERRGEATKPDKKQPQQKRSTRGGRPDPLPPSWRRSFRRSLILGGVVLVMFTLLQGLLPALLLAIIYTGIFVPFTYYVDRFAYNRWLRNQASRGAKKKR